VESRKIKALKCIKFDQNTEILKEYFKIFVRRFAGGVLIQKVLSLCLDDLLRDYIASF
jgi:hypothetical protein